MVEREQRLGNKSRGCECRSRSVQTKRQGAGVTSNRESNTFPFLEELQQAYIARLWSVCQWSLIIARSLSHVMDLRHCQK